jgi:hypothetical protein
MRDISGHSVERFAKMARCKRPEADQKVVERPARRSDGHSSVDLIGQLERFWRIALQCFNLFAQLLQQVSLAAAVMTFLSVHTFAQEPDKTRKPGPQSIQRPDGTPRYQLLNINNITTWMRADGQSNHSPTGGDGTYFPRGTRWVIYQDGFIWGAKAFIDSSYTIPAPMADQFNIRVGGQTYNIGTVQGWVIGEGASAVGAPQTDPENRIYRIRRDYFTMSTAALIRDAAEYFETVIGALTQEQIQQIKAQYETDWNEWPVHRGAPYIERNGIPGYQSPPPFTSTFGPDDLIAGRFDEPGMTGQDPNLPADQVIWTVYNDLNRFVTTGLYGSEPLGLEVQVTLWGYKRNTPIDNSYFRRARFINKGGVDIGGGQRGFLWIDSMFIAQWSDPDVGAFGDDLVGCDTLLSMGFAYNGNERDREFDMFNLPPPAIGYDFLQGPTVAASPADTGVFNFHKIAGRINLPLLAFTYLSAGSPSPEPFTREGALRWWKQLRGFVPEASTISPRLYPHPPGVTPGRFPLSGDPVTGTGFIDGLGTNYSLPMGDRRIALSAGPIRLAPRDTQEIVVAVIGGIGADRLSSIAVMKFNDRYVQDAYDRLLALPRSPAEPRVNVAVLDEEVILEWASDHERVRETEAESPPSGYGFEGYNVYQLPSDSAQLSEGAKIATFDRANNIRHIYDLLPDPRTGLPVPTLVQYGNDSGVKRHIRITHDAIHGGRLRNGTEYHFAVTAYNYSPYPEAIPRSLESEPRVYTVRPRVPFGMQIGTRFGDTLQVMHTQGRSDGEVIPIVIDPLRGTGHGYEVRFDTSGGPTKWYVRNATTNMIVVADQTNQSNEEGFLNVEGGILLKVLGPPPGLKRQDMFDTDNENLWGWKWLPNSGVRFLSWAGADGLALEGFRGAAGWRSPHVAFGPGTREPISPDHLRIVELRFAATSDNNGTFNPADTNASYAYRYGSNFDQPPAQPSFAPFIINSLPGYSYQDYTLSMPLAAYDMDTTPPRRLAIGYLENNVTQGLVNGRYWPPLIGLPHNTNEDGPREWLFIFDVDYTGSTPDPALQMGMIANPLPVMYWATWARRNDTPWPEGNTMVLIPARLNTVNDIFSYTSIAPEANDALRKTSARRVGVFPNPYYAGQTDGSAMRGRFVTFNNLPPKAIIRIYNLAGHLVRTLRKDDPSQFFVWDLKNENNWLIASGVYICHVEMPEIGEVKILKLAVIQEALIPPVR